MSAGCVIVRSIAAVPSPSPTSSSLGPPPRRKAALRELLPEGARVHHPSGQRSLGSSSDPAELFAELQKDALELGLLRLAVTSPAPLAADEARLRAWLDEGHGAALDYMGQAGAPDHDRAHPSRLLPEARAVLVVAVHYPPPRPEKDFTEVLRGGRVAAYARGEDYHHLIKDRLLLLADALADLVGHPVRARACVDTAPLLERALAQRAGLGFVGKNTLLITPGLGSYFLLGELLVDVTLQAPVQPPPLDGCGRCTACLDACPTDAFAAPFVLDAGRCVSYLTIETVGDMPRELRAGVGSRVFGCDACQSVCPYNQTAHKKPSDPGFAPRPHLDLVDLERLLFLGSAPYRTFVRRSALRRIHREELCRNAAVALGNTGAPEAVAPLTRALHEHPIDFVRHHAAWALGRLGYDFGLEEARAVLLEARAHPDEAVREEIERWLGAEAAPRPPASQ